MSSNNRKSFLVRSALILILFAATFGVTGVRASVLQTEAQPVSIFVHDTDATPMAGLNVYAYSGRTFTGIQGVTGSDGLLTLELPDGAYHFRVDYNGTRFWSSTANHCLIPGCDSVGVTVTKPVTVTVLNTDGQPKAGLVVYAFSSYAYTGYSQTTDAAGQAIFTLPLGHYRFRADYSGTEYWTGDFDSCSLPGCTEGYIYVAEPPPSVVCNNITTGALEQAGDTMRLAIDNPNPYALDVGSVFVVWNHDRGHSFGGDKTLKLQSAQLGGVVFYSSDPPQVGPSLTITPDPGVVVPSGPSAIVFTFHQTYTTWDVPPTETVLITLTTPGCETYPIYVTR